MHTQKLRENSMKLTTVRRDVQDMMKVLNDWSEQIDVAKQALENTENKLKDADESRNW